MAGERILLVDDSAAAQDLISRTLEGRGYHVVSASNGVAALSYPEMDKVSLAIVDSGMSGFNGEETIKFLRSSENTHRLPILLLIPLSHRDERSSQTLFGADGYLFKPFEPGQIVRQVEALIEEANIENRVRERLMEAADKRMSEIAEQHIQSAIEKRTQIIAERAIQNVVTMVDQQARREVEAKITALSAEKEQQLVKATVHEVAQSMVEKLAERKVAEAMEKILAEETAKTVKRSADAALPGMMRERLRDAFETAVPREIAAKVQKAAEDLVPEISAKIVQMIEGVANQAVPKVARERVPEIAERQLRAATEERIPKQVRDLVDRELGNQVRIKLNPLIENARFRIESRLKTYNIVLFVLVGLLTALNIVFFFKR